MIPLPYFFNNEERKEMAFPKDTQVEVTGVDNDNIYLQVGGNGYTVPKGDLQYHVSGQGEELPSLLHNISINLALCGTDLADDIAVKEAIEARTYKIFR